MNNQFINPSRWLPFLNETSEDIPPYSVMKVTGMKEHNGRMVLEVEKSTNFGAQFSHAVTSSTPTKPDKIGKCLMDDMPFFAELSEEVGSGEDDVTICGPVVDKWELIVGSGGYRVLSEKFDGGNFYVIKREPLLGTRIEALSDHRAGEEDIEHRVDREGDGVSGDDEKIIVSEFISDSVESEDLDIIEEGGKAWVSWDSVKDTWVITAVDCGV